MPVQVVVDFDGVRTEVAVTDREAVALLNGRAVAFAADDVEPFVSEAGQVGERVRRPEVEEP
jgi:hypothetical protein